MENFGNLSQLHIQDNEKSGQVFASLLQDVIAVGHVECGEDREKDIFTCFNATQETLEVIPEMKDGITFHKVLDFFIDRFVFISDRERFFNETRRDTIFEELERTGTYVVTFRGRRDGVNKYYQMKFTTPQKGVKIANYVVVLKNADTEVAKEKEANEELEQLVKLKTYELQNSNRFLEQINGDIVELFSMVIEKRNQESGDHVRRVKMFTKILAVRLMKDYPEYGLTESKVGVITMASALHDIGKISIPDNILTNPGRLSPQEFEIMKTHCVKGAEILDTAPASVNTEYIKVGKEICLNHHEKWDGSGYPSGKKGDEIPISAQIVSVADCYEALTAKRSYKEPLHPDTAFDMILFGDCGEFNPKLIECFKKSEQQFKRNVLNKELDYAAMASKMKLEGVLKGMKLLVVDDDLLSQDICEEILADEGAKVTCANDGADAVELMRDENNKFDAILMDMVMPVMNGIEATKRIREIEKRGATRIPIVALSAHSTESDIKEILAAGADSFMEKPIQVMEFQAILFEIMRKQSAKLEQELVETIEVANTDVLTHVKNIAAYSDAVADLAESIRMNVNTRFAVVMCDLNDLKKVNDAYGHDTGDVYIRNGCGIICDIFKKSPVFRIGGDEFVVIVMDEDYEKRSILIKQLQIMELRSNRIEKIKDGKVSFSFGMADYDPSTDYLVSDVVKKADIAMYDMKNARKVGRS